MQPRAKYINDPGSCTHKRTGFIGTKWIEHRVCYDCRYHWYDGKEYTYEEWERWVNNDGPETEITFYGIDAWHHPVFVDKHRNFYGDYNNVFDRDATEKDVLEKTRVIDLTFFGRKFGCEPMGTICKEGLVIAKGKDCVFIKEEREKRNER